MTINLSYKSCHSSTKMTIQIHVNALHWIGGKSSLIRNSPHYHFQTVFQSHKSPLEKFTCHYKFWLGYFRHSTTVIVNSVEKIWKSTIFAMILDRIWIPPCWNTFECHPVDGSVGMELKRFLPAVKREHVNCLSTTKCFVYIEVGEGAGAIAGMK